MAARARSKGGDRDRQAPRQLSAPAQAASRAEGWHDEPRLRSTRRTQAGSLHECVTNRALSWHDEIQHRVGYTGSKSTNSLDHSHRYGRSGLVLLHLQNDLAEELAAGNQIVADLHILEGENFLDYGSQFALFDKLENDLVC